ncbi:hypothetical protein ACFFV7_35765 [Nonomuraea spiralis]|uniref:Uncharacterized protein n=1 Tax=Nonomuraea spiralis TaxID=46182 RepID=A0ABV5IPZ5_9ACTN|nr:hypothetical protein [Nonomuraea spiralis]
MLAELVDVVGPGELRRGGGRAAAAHHHGVPGGRGQALQLFGGQASAEGRPGE